MRISFNWLKDFIEIQDSHEQVADILTSLGLEVEAVEILEEIPGGLKGVIIGEIIECIKHPNADRLSLTKVDIGSGELLQIVCGAPNVAVGQKVLVATENTTLYPSGKEPFIIKKGKIRGEVSEGMICAEDELGLGTGHDGIIILREDAPIGISAGDYLKLSSDVIFEIGLTPNRSDAMHHLGVAKDLLAWYRVHRDPSLNLTTHFPTISTNKKNSLPISVQINDEKRSPRYSFSLIENIQVKPSQEWMQKRLKAMGQKPVNNVVDITNYIMYEMGQPMHAFDYDEIKGQTIIVQCLKSGTDFTTLDLIERKLKDTDLMICDANSNPLCIAGVLGGTHSGVSDKTKHVLLESAHFQASSIRKTSTAHLIRSQAAKCYEKGTDATITQSAILRFQQLLNESLESDQYNYPIQDIYPTPIEPSQILLSLEEVIRLSGIQFSIDTLKQVLFALDMELTDLQNGQLLVQPGLNKPDVTRAADIIEEIIRVYGFDHIPLPDQIKISFPKNVSSSFEYRKKIGDWLIANGLNEIMSLSLCNSTLLTPLEIWSKEDLIYIHNTSNEQLDIMKPSLLFGGLEAIQFNQNRQHSDLSLFEFGKSYVKNQHQLIEKQKLGIWLTGSKKQIHWNSPKEIPQDFYELKAWVEGILLFSKIDNITFSAIENNSIFSFGGQWSKNEHIIVQAGLVHEKIKTLYDIKKPVWYADFDLETLRYLLPIKSKGFTEFSKFPAVKRDLALVIPKDIRFKQLEELAFKNGGSILKDVSLFDIYENAEQMGPDRKSYALKFILEHPERSMTSEEIDDLMNRLILAFESQLGATVRR
ncbi:MAG: phenylalanine--tRNA ligase subunit beta [Bacteroidota bacterium]|nr:phenylalanine--tRNA ligase subunit beta [Bacteroidota bacterium]